MVDAEEVVVPHTNIRVAVSYPLREKHVFSLSSDDAAGFRRCELALKISLFYQRIYDEEDRSSSEPPSLVPGLLNRARTQGTYGIWGHVLGDLVLVGVIYEPDSDVWRLQVDS